MAAFRELFPVTTWCWCKLSSRRGRIGLATLALVVLVPAVGFRAEMAIFGQRSSDILRALGDSRLGEPEATTLYRLSRFHPQIHRHGESNCEADECLVIAIPESWMADRLLIPTARVGWRRVSGFWSWWGIRYRTLDAGAEFKSGRLVRFGYRLWISTRELRSPGIISLSATSVARPPGRIDAHDDESPEFRVGHYFKWPKLSLSVYFTAGAPQLLVKHAFHPNFLCVWRWEGCSEAAQILSDSEKDRLSIAAAAVARLASSDPCPLRVLVHRARYADDVLVAHVEAVKGAFDRNEDGTKYRTANVRLVQVLKGSSRVRLNSIGISSEISVDGRRVPNQIADQITAGQTLLLFSGGTDYFELPCEATTVNRNDLADLESELKR